MFQTTNQEKNVRLGTFLQFFFMKCSEVEVCKNEDVHRLKKMRRQNLVCLFAKKVSRATFGMFSRQNEDLRHKVEAAET